MSRYRDRSYRRWRQEVIVKKRLIFRNVCTNWLYRHGRTWMSLIGTEEEHYLKTQTSCSKFPKHYKKRYYNDKNRLNRLWKRELYHILYLD